MNSQNHRNKLSGHEGTKTRMDSKSLNQSPVGLNLKDFVFSLCLRVFVAIFAAKKN